MFIKQHTFLGIKSEITLLFIYLCISYITLNLLLAEELLIWTQTLFFCFGQPDDWTDQSKITKKWHQICEQPSLLYRFKGAIECCPSSFSPCWQEGQRSFVFFQGSLDWLEETRNQNATHSRTSLFDMSQTRINTALPKLFPSVLGSRPKGFVFV